jgi:hypothetical protein
MIALAELKRSLDVGAERGGLGRNDVDAIDAYAYRHEFTFAQTEKAHAYAKAGGEEGALTQSMLNEAYRRLHPEESKPTQKTAALWDVVAGRLEPGKQASAEQVVKIMARLELEGETPGFGFAVFDRGENETYGEALANERGDAWGPPEKDYRRIRAMLENAGVKATDERIRETYFQEKKAL